VPQENPTRDSCGLAKNLGGKNPPSTQRKRKYIMNTHSPTTASDILEQLIIIDNDIQNTILIGEKVQMIMEAGHLYNHLKSLVTPDYFIDEEFDWLKETAKSWNDDVINFAKQQSGRTDFNVEENLKELEKTIEEALEDLIGGIDDMEDFLDED